MALNATEEAQLRLLIAQQAAILSLASNESTITSKLAATKVTLADLPAAASPTDADLFLIRQGSAEKSLTAAALKASVLASVPTPPPGIPIGASIEWNGTAAPDAEWMIEDGAAISRTTYATLFARIGTTHGAGNGTTTFNIPDSRNRAAVGAGGLYAVGAKGGSKDAIVVAHGHTINDPQHGHGMLAGNDGSNFGSFIARDEAQEGANLSTLNSPTGITVNSTGASGTDANMMPYIGKLKIIKVL